MAGGEARHPGAQVFYAGAVKPRDFTYDSQLFRKFEIERKRLEAEGAWVRRVHLDYVLKQQYQTHLNQPGDDPFEVRQGEFAQQHDFTIIDGQMRTCSRSTYRCSSR